MFSNSCLLGSGSTEDDVNTLDLLPEDKLYIGVIKVYSPFLIFQELNCIKE